jgi:hypothetical protein
MNVLQAIEKSSEGNRKQPIFIRPVKFREWESKAAYAALGGLEFFTDYEKHNGHGHTKVMPDVSELLEDWEVLNG